MKRHLFFPRDFDTRSHLLEEPGEHWDEVPKRLHQENRKRLIASLHQELGAIHFERKLKNFKDAGFSPFSIIAYHNNLYQQLRYAFIMGFYYPALVSACALGERILNHLMIDLRDSFKGTAEYKYVYRKESFDDWEVVISTLENWQVFQQKDVASEFRQLQALRHRSIHFNPTTYNTLRDDALSALGHLRKIISCQFGFGEGQKWIIPDTKGAAFIKKESEADPFIRAYYLPQCPLVGPYYSVRLAPDRIYFHDKGDYPANEISDAEFTKLFDSRTPEMMARSEGELPATQTVQFLPG